MLLKKSISLLVIKKLKQIYLEYKLTIQLCVDIFVYNLLIICSRVKLYYEIILIYFLLMTLKRIIELLKKYLKNE